MNREIDDNLLTAYVLGELSETQLADVRERIAADPELQRAVAEIEESAGLLRAGFEREVMRFGRTARPPRWWSSAAIGIAASVVVGGMLAAAIVTQPSRHVEVASNSGQELPAAQGVAATQPTRRGEIFTVPLANQEKEKLGNKSLDDWAHVSYSTGAPTRNVTDDKYKVNQRLTPDLSNVAGISSSTTLINGADRSDALAIAKTPTLSLGTAPDPVIVRGTIVSAESTLAVRGSSVTLGGATTTGRYALGNRQAGDATEGNAFYKAHNTVLPQQTDSEEAGVRREWNDSKRLKELNDPSGNTESYSRIVETPFLESAQNPLSTFSVDVDTASYANARRFIQAGQLPPKYAVRIEEMVNYFPYHYAQPKGDDAFATSVEAADCPWAQGHRLVRIGIKGREVAEDNRPAMSLTFLIDVSGSMLEPNKLPLVKESLKMLVKKLRPSDRVGIVVYAGNTGLVLPSTQAGEKEMILSKIDALEAGGSTNGAAGIQLAYQTAQSAFIKDGVNRVILCTDGDWNVGVTNEGDLTRMIEEKAKSGVFLSVLGFGMGNLKDSMMVKLADKGNGNYGYVDTEREAKKLLVDQMSGTLVTIAKDVKIQVEFNPLGVSSYRLIGYEKRILAKEDFNDDKKDAGEIGAGHTVTALYEVIPPGADDARPAVDPLKYQGQSGQAADRRLHDAAQAGEMLTVKVRYKQPDGDVSKKLEFPFKDDGKDFSHASNDMQFAVAVTEFAMVLRDSQYKGTSNLGAAIEIGQSAAGDDAYRREFVDLAKKAAAMLAPGR